MSSEVKKTMVHEHLFFALSYLERTTKSFYYFQVFTGTGTYEESIRIRVSTILEPDTDPKYFYTDRQDGNTGLM